MYMVIRSTFPLVYYLYPSFGHLFIHYLLQVLGIFGQVSMFQILVNYLFGISVYYQELLLYYKLSQESYQVYIIHQILIQHILVFSFLLEKSIMDGVYIIFILVEHHLSFFSFFFILEELYLMVHTFIIQILGFLEFFFSSS